MIIFRTLEWENCFSYGTSNKIELDKDPLTQLVGINGAGKTSIQLILQEVLFGKNIKNVKKADITNRTTGVKGYNITLTFDKDSDNYKIVLNRKSSLKISLIKNGVDISSHTALNTYKTISDIIGVNDFKVFCQLSYQSSTDSLEFLTATDTNRKKFLINLLNFERYIELHEHFKEVSRERKNEISTISGAIDNINSWISRHSTMDFTKREQKYVLELDESLVTELADLESKLKNIKNINNKINSNQSYLEILQNIDPKYVGSLPPYLTEDPDKILADINRLKGRIQEANKIITKYDKLTYTTQCHTCEQEIDKENVVRIIEEQQSLLIELEKDTSKLQDVYTKLMGIKKEIKKHTDAEALYEKYSLLYDPDLPNEALMQEEISSKINSIKQEINKQNKERQEAIDYNNKVAAINSKIDLVKSQLVEYNEQLDSKKAQKDKLEKEFKHIELLKKVFSTNGLVSYKIESSIKNLESKINEYLSALGSFRIFFKINGDKLNIEVLDGEGRVTGIESLSSGERARVNIATVLAIRSALGSLSSTKFNILFLDEVIGVIDTDGREMLTDLLLKENLNTIMVSHEYEHPLVPKINIVKENKISRIEYGD